MVSPWDCDKAQVQHASGGSLQRLRTRNHPAWKHSSLGRRKPSGRREIYASTAARCSVHMQRRASPHPGAPSDIYARSSSARSIQPGMLYLFVANAQPPHWLGLALGCRGKGSKRHHDPPPPPLLVGRWYLWSFVLFLLLGTFIRRSTETESRRRTSGSDGASRQIARPVAALWLAEECCSPNGPTMGKSGRRCVRWYHPAVGATLVLL